MLIDMLLLVFAGLMIAAALSDAVRYTIPNWLCGAIAILFPLAAVAAGLGWAQTGMHLLGGSLALLIGFALFAPGWIGGGDAKLFAAAALWFGWDGLFPLLFHTAIAGGGLVLALLILRQAAPFARLPAGWIRQTALEQGAPVPYGLAIAAGVLWSLPASALFAAH